jgi:hypothetical protein
MNSIRNIIGEKRYKLATNQNTNLSLDLENKTKVLNNEVFFEVVNAQNVFEVERNESNKYRFNGKLNIYTSNALSTTATSNDWDPLFKDNPPTTPNNWVMQITYPSFMDDEYEIKYSHPVFGLKTKAYRGLQYTKLSSTFVNGSNKLTIIGVQRHNLEIGDFVYLVDTNYQGFHRVQSLGISGNDLKTSVTLDTFVDTVTGVTTNYNNFKRVLNVSKNDISFNNPNTFNYTESTDISGNTGMGYTKIVTTSNHELSINNFVDIRVGSSNPLNGVWKVVNILAPNVFIVKVETLANYNFSSAKYRILDCTPSEYYIRYFELLTSNEYEVYKCAFSSNIYSNVIDPKIGTANDTWAFQYNKDINIKNLKDNRNGKISELYYTIIKRAGLKTYPWSDVVADWDFNATFTNLSNGLETISKINPNGIGSVEKKTQRTESVNQAGDLVFNSGDFYFGEFVEFNMLEIIERPVADVIHRFGLNSNPNGRGYYYKPFQNLQIRVYSTQIETADADEIVIDLPENFVTYADGSLAWKDLLPIGYYEDDNNGVDYPFNNGANYFYFNKNLYVRVQPIYVPPPTQTTTQTTTQTVDNAIVNINEEC